jgi:hypothetical protein
MLKRKYQITTKKTFTVLEFNDGSTFKYEENEPKSYLDQLNDTISFLSDVIEKAVEIQYNDEYENEYLITVVKLWKCGDLSILRYNDSEVPRISDFVNRGIVRSNVHSLIEDIELNLHFNTLRILLNCI